MKNLLAIFAACIVTQAMADVTIPISNKSEYAIIKTESVTYSSNLILIAQARMNFFKESKFNIPVLISATCTEGTFDSVIIGSADPVHYVFGGKTLRDRIATELCAEAIDKMRKDAND